MRRHCDDFDNRFGARPHDDHDRHAEIDIDGSCGCGYNYGACGVYDGNDEHCGCGDCNGDYLIVNHVYCCGDDDYSRND